MKRSRKRRLLLLALVSGCVFVAIGITLLVAEFVLRSRAEHFLHAIEEVRYLLQSDDRGGIVTARHWSGFQTVEGRTVPVHTNNLGLRRCDDLNPKPPGEQRILFLGDSMVYGHGVGDDETFCHILEADWTKSGSTIVVGNGGIASIGLSDQRAPLRRYLTEFEPDLVVSCLYLGNDLVDHLEERAVVEGFLLINPDVTWAKASWRFRLAHTSFVAFEIETLLVKHFSSLALRPPRRLDDVLPPPPEGCRAIYQEGIFMDQVAPLAAHVQELWRRVEAILGEVRDQAKPVPLAVLVIPTSIHVIPGHYELFLRSTLTGLDPTRCRRGEAQRRLVAICKRLGVPAFDLTRLLADDPDPASNWLTLDRHLSPRGHRVVARWLRPRLAALLQD